MLEQTPRPRKRHNAARSSSPPTLYTMMNGVAGDTYCVPTKGMAVGTQVSDERHPASDRQDIKRQPE